MRIFINFCLNFVWSLLQCQWERAFRCPRRTQSPEWKYKKNHLLQDLNALSNFDVNCTKTLTYPKKLKSTQIWKHYKLIKMILIDLSLYYKYHQVLSGFFSELGLKLTTRRKLEKFDKNDHFFYAFFWYRFIQCIIN